MDARSIIISNWWCVGSVDLPSFSDRIELDLLDLTIISLHKDLSFSDNMFYIVFWFST